MRRDQAAEAGRRGGLVYDDETTPEGVVARRPGGPPQRPQRARQPEPAEVYDDALGESVDDYVDDPPMSAETEFFSDEDGINNEDMFVPMDGIWLLDGDLVYGKVHHTVYFDDDMSNFSLGVTTRVKPGESEEEVFNRVSTLLNQRVLDMATDAYQPVMNVKNDAYELREKAARERANTKGRLRPREER